MLLLIDNYDSFTYNLVHFLGDLGARCVVHRNDQITVDEATALKPAGIVLSPGPCTPNEAGICMDLVRASTDVPAPEVAFFERDTEWLRSLPCSSQRMTESPCNSRVPPLIASISTPSTSSLIRYFPS